MEQIFEIKIARYVNREAGVQAIRSMLGDLCPPDQVDLVLNNYYHILNNGLNVMSIRVVSLIYPDVREVSSINWVLRDHQLRAPPPGAGFQPPHVA
jgi:hypothetical protein